MFTNTLFALKEGDVVGYRGPYGNGFTLVENKKVCIVAGGIGMAALSLLYHTLKQNNDQITLIYGAKTCSDLIFKQNVCDRNSCICTDDGSDGKKAFTTQLLEQQIKEHETEHEIKEQEMKALDKQKFDMIYICGPEIMMKIAVDICIKHNIPCEASLERFMCCGFGICGKCAINDKLVCVDGPVFSKEELAILPDFGKHVCKCNHQSV
jgi:dihydroorotate dehydrogenase electron transfer subunit